jgi:hypothetical protein
MPRAWPWSSPATGISGIDSAQGHTARRPGVNLAQGHVAHGEVKLKPLAIRQNGRHQVDFWIGVEN